MPVVQNNVGDTLDDAVHVYYENGRMHASNVDFSGKSVPQPAQEFLLYDTVMRVLAETVKHSVDGLAEKFQTTIVRSRDTSGYDGPSLLRTYTSGEDLRDLLDTAATRLRDADGDYERELQALAHCDPASFMYHSFNPGKEKKSLHTHPGNMGVIAVRMHPSVRYAWEVNDVDANGRPQADQEHIMTVSEEDTLYMYGNETAHRAVITASDNVPAFSAGHTISMFGPEYEEHTDALPDVSQNEKVENVTGEHLREISEFYAEAFETPILS